MSEEVEARSGFSFLYLIVLLLGLTGLATVGIPVWFGRVDVTLENAARLLAKDLKDTQDWAAFRHGALQVVFDEWGDGYTVMDLHGNTVVGPCGDRPFQRRYSHDAVFRGVRIEEAEVGPENALHFGPRGLAKGAGQIVLAFRDQRRHVRIEGTSGRVTIDGEPYPPQ